tara:strand:+ start:620 stop:958 length:339 start_codon:yes stop_codon:yes gene_type:complete
MVFVEIENLEQYTNALLSKEYEELLILAYFTAKWCGPCKTVSPILKRIGEEKSTVVVLKVDVDDCEEVSEHCEIDCMPTFLFYKNNNLEPVHRFSGADLDLLVQNITNFLNE